MSADLKGLVFDISRACYEDGPGLRTVVFLKGCPLDCPWCHNLEGKSFAPEIAFAAASCIACGECRKACPRGIRPDEWKNWREGCRACGKCAEACPARARILAGREFGVEELIREAARDEDFFRGTGGGVTFSGGEPLAQPEFVLAAARALRGKKIHVAVETSGFWPGDLIITPSPLRGEGRGEGDTNKPDSPSPQSPPLKGGEVLNESRFEAPPDGRGNLLERVAETFDLILFDLKHVNPGKFRKATGKENQGILENLKGLIEKGVSLEIRIPLIPGFNNSPEDLREIAGFLKGLSRVPPVTLLPFHRLARSKEGRFDRKYPYADFLPISEKELAAAKALLRQEGIAG